MLKFNSILVGTENPEPLVAFYRQVLGEPVMEQGGFTTWANGSTAITIGLHSEVKGRAAEPARVIWFFETPDVKGEFERVKALGAEVVREPYEMEGGFWLATFADPDGNYFNLASPFPT